MRGSLNIASMGHLSRGSRLSLNLASLGQLRHVANVSINNPPRGGGSQGGGIESFAFIPYDPNPKSVDEIDHILNDNEFFLFLQ